jgi:hypothetical protein
MELLRKHIMPAVLFCSLVVNVYQYNAIRFYEDGVAEALYLLGGENSAKVSPKEAMAALLEHIYNNWLN